MSARSFELADLQWERLDAGLERQVVDCVTMTVTRYRFAPGGRFPNHVHDQEQITYVIDGELSFSVEGRPYALTTGSMIVIPPEVAHSALAGETGADVLSVVSPPRTQQRAVRMLEGT